jgi:DNA-binding MarR family transcriptional regulator
MSNLLAVPASSGKTSSATSLVDRSECTCFHVRKLARRVTQFYDRALASCGLRVTQYSLLSQLAAHGSLPMKVLADLLDMDRTTLTRNLKPLIDAKLVALARSAADARVRTVVLTAAGRARRAAAHRIWRRAQNAVDLALGDARVTALHRQLDELTDAFNGGIGTQGGDSA